MTPMRAWCYYCERRLIWHRPSQQWRPTTPPTTVQKGQRVRLSPTMCALSPRGFGHEPVPEKTDVLRRSTE